MTNQFGIKFVYLEMFIGTTKSFKQIEIVYIKIYT